MQDKTMNIFEYFEWYNQEKDKIALSYEAAMEFEQYEELKEAVDKLYDLNFMHYKTIESLIEEINQLAIKEENSDLKTRLNTSVKTLKECTSGLTEFLNQLAEITIELDADLDSE